MDHNLRTKLYLEPFEICEPKLGFKVMSNKSHELEQLISYFAYTKTNQYNIFSTSLLSKFTLQVRRVNQDKTRTENSSKNLTLLPESYKKNFK